MRVHVPNRTEGFSVDLDQSSDLPRCRAVRTTWLPRQSARSRAVSDQAEMCF
jgi:hypothetical protein